jgi:hypothetical protein
MEVFQQAPVGLNLMDRVSDADQPFRLPHFRKMFFESKPVTRYSFAMKVRKENIASNMHFKERFHLVIERFSVLLVP